MKRKFRGKLKKHVSVAPDPGIRQPKVVFPRELLLKDKRKAVTVYLYDKRFELFAAKLNRFDRSASSYFNEVMLAFLLS